MARVLTYSRVTLTWAYWKSDSEIINFFVLTGLDSRMPRKLIRTLPLGVSMREFLEKIVL